jgi:DNA-binding transcriptional MerR regulator
VGKTGLLSVGQFARRAGLTTHALRHYDAVGLLAPARTDAATGYRRYSLDQLVTARLIADLRWLSVPIAVVRQIIDDPQSSRARELLAAHAEQLSRDLGHLQRQIDQSTTYASQGVPMPKIPTAVTPVQVKVAVGDIARARGFYEEAFGLTEQVIRHTDSEDFSGFQFGEYGQPGFFLLVLVDQTDFDAPGRSTLGLSTPDLEATHRRALQAGAVESVAITDVEGMPRTSAVTDPDGNWIWLYQA